MEIGDILREMGAAVRADDPDKIKAKIAEVRGNLILESGLRDPFGQYSAFAKVVNSNLGYLTGYMPTEYANKVLAWCDLEHPFFGPQIPESADEALAMGIRLGEELREVKIAKERKEKRAMLAGKGIDLPDVTDTVSSADAKEILEKLREAKMAEAMKAKMEADARAGIIKTVIEREIVSPITTSKFSPLGSEAPREITVANPIEKLIAPKAPEPVEVDEDEDDDYYDMDDDDELADIPEPTVVTPAKPEDVARILSDHEEAGAF